MKILVTGTEGYLGSLLAPILMRAGHDVLAVDTGFYKSGWLYHGTPMTPRTLIKDIRHISVEDLDEIKAVVHMAELTKSTTRDLSGWRSWRSRRAWDALSICRHAASTESRRRVI